MKRYLLLTIFILTITCLCCNSSDADNLQRIACKYKVEITDVDWSGEHTTYDSGIMYYILDDVNKEILSSEGEPFADLKKGSNGLQYVYNDKKIHYVKEDVHNGRPTKLILYFDRITGEYYNYMQIKTQGLFGPTFPSSYQTKKGYCSAISNTKKF